MQSNRYTDIQVYGEMSIKYGLRCRPSSVHTGQYASRQQSANADQHMINLSTLSLQAPRVTQGASECAAGAAGSNAQGITRQTCR